MIRTSFFFLLAALILSPAHSQEPAAAGAVHKIELPPETGVYGPGEGLALAQTFCMTCHSTEYVESQPPMPAAYWEGIVKKMTEKFGAPIPPTTIPDLVKYLADTYGAKSK